MADPNLNISQEISTQERDLIKSILDFSFIIKGQLQSEQTALLRSILNILIMEAEDVLENADALGDSPDGNSANRFT